MELNVEGSGCQNELSVYQNSAASRPYFILATYSKYGSINGGFRHVNCTEDENEVLSVIPAAGLGAQTLAYIPSEKSSDSIRYELYSIHTCVKKLETQKSFFDFLCSFSMVRRQRALKTDDHEEHTNRNSNNVTNVHRTINLPVINGKDIRPNFAWTKVSTAAYPVLLSIWSIIKKRSTIFLAKQ